jgi:AcrR family transcriptional regulator
MGGIKFNELLNSDGISKKLKIIKAAMHIFSGNLFHQVTMEEVATQAGVGKGTIYLYFKSKEDLFQQTFKYATKIYLEKIFKGLQELHDPKDKLKKIVNLQLDFSQEDFKVFNFLAESMAPALTFHEEIIKTWQKFILLIEEIIKEGIEKGCFRKTDTYLASRLFLGGLVSLVTGLIFNQEEIKNKERLAGDITDIFLNGLHINKAEGELKS